MAIEINVPRLGWSMEEGVFGQWLKRPGEQVKSGEMLFVLEGDKASQEIESFDEGILYVPPSAPKNGQAVKVGQVLGWLLAKGESPPNEAPQTNSPPQPAVAGLKEPTKASAPAAASQVNAPVASVPPIATKTQSTVASPRARRVAEAMGIDWRSLKGTGAEGRVRERDVMEFSQQRAAASGDDSRQSGRLAPISAVRRLTAERMLASSQQTAPVTLTSTVDATNLVNLREQFRPAAPADPSAAPLPSYTDFLVKLAAMTLAEHPAVSAQWREDGLFQPERINVAIAVDTPHGLVAPVVLGANLLTLRRLAVATADLIARARSRQLTPAETQDGAFTVSNLGAFGIDAFTPIINLPQTAILGVGRIRLGPAVWEGQIVARHQLTLSLTFDHRVVDGAPAARFLQALGQSIEQPAARLIE